MKNQNVKERPILFSGSIMKAVLDGRKTQSRRLIQNLPQSNCPYGYEKSRLWVMETFATPSGKIFYRADYNNAENADLKRKYNFKWTGATYMPRNLSRITLEIDEIRLERLHDISESDAVAEGMDRFNAQDTPRGQFQTLWGYLHGKESWKLNPWVWVLQFNKL